jgi:tetratricopeptide (TPR) repeat protein
MVVMKTKLSLLIIVTSIWVTTCAVTANVDMDSFNNPVNENANAHTCIVKGIEYYKSGNYEEAIKCYDMAIALEPETETAEAGWAGKELAFYRQGKSEEALCCYYKLKNIDLNTNLIERRKKELMNSMSDPATSSLFDLTGKVLASLTKKEVVVEIGTYMAKRETSVGVGMILAPEITGPAFLLLTAYDVYTHRDEILNAINDTFSETNGTKIY